MTFEIHEVNPRCDYNTEGWSAKLCESLENFACKWMDDWSHYIVIPPGRLDPKYDWGRRLLEDLPDDVLERIVDGKLDLFVELEFPEDY